MATHIRPASSRTHDLQSLAALDVKDLGDLYARGSIPARMDALEGRPRGRMLAIRGVDRGITGGLLRRFAGSAGFPWSGKSFFGSGVTGTGINRIVLGGKHNLFPFLTSQRPSVIDGAPCIVLDYDLPDNPGVIRMIHDELREIDPGLFLGPAMLKTKSGPKFVLWFALDTEVQVAADPRLA